jgi:hypothetical protein
MKTNASIFTLKIYESKFMVQKLQDLKVLAMYFSLDFVAILAKSH